MKPYRNFDEMVASLRGKDSSKIQSDLWPIRARFDIDEREEERERERERERGKSCINRGVISKIWRLVRSNRNPRQLSGNRDLNNFTSIAGLKNDHRKGERTARRRVIFDLRTVDGKRFSASVRDPPCPFPDICQPLRPRTSLSFDGFEIAATKSIATARNNSGIVLRILL